MLEAKWEQIHKKVIDVTSRYYRSKKTKHYSSHKNRKSTKINKLNGFDIKVNDLVLYSFNCNLLYPIALHYYKRERRRPILWLKYCEIVYKLKNLIKFKFVSGTSHQLTLSYILTFMETLIINGYNTHLVKLFYSCSSFSPILERILSQ